jgi:Zn-finger nucleic acid-binding protein
MSFFISSALHHGRPSAVMCPACTQPFTEVVGASAAVTLQLKVCTRCFWVWLSPELDSVVFARAGRQLMRWR